jgi:hypothetical protein
MFIFVFYTEKGIRIGVKAKRLVGRLKRRWFGQILEGEKEKLARNFKGRVGDFSSIDPHKMETCHKCRKTKEKVHGS